MITELCIITLLFPHLQSQAVQHLPYGIECPTVECAEGYTFKGAPYCGCFKPEDLPSDTNNNAVNPNPTPVDIRQLPYYYPGIPYSLLQQYLLSQQSTQTPPGSTVNPLPPVQQVPPSTNTSSTNNCNLNLIRCGSDRTLDLNLCQCICNQQPCPLAFQVFNQQSCQCEPQGCPNTCARCEVQDPSTCDCKSIVSCPNGRILDHETCQCFCNTECNNELQKVNQNTCQCECTLFTTIVERVVQHRVTRESLYSDGDGDISENGRHRVRRKGKKNKKKGRKETSGQVNTDKGDSTSTKSKEKSKKREKSGKSKSKGRTNTRRLPQQPPAQQPPSVISQQPPIIATQPPPSISQPAPPITPQTVSAEVKVFRCPLGKVPNPMTCACN